LSLFIIYSQKTLLLGLLHLAELSTLRLLLLLAAAALAHAHEHDEEDEPDHPEFSHEHVFSGEFALLPVPVLALVYVFGSIEKPVHALRRIAPHTVQFICASAAFGVLPTCGV